jgi:hypothetical protein
MQCKVLDPPYVDFVASLIHVHDPIVDLAAMKIILSCEGSAYDQNLEFFPLLRRQGGPF